MREHSFAISSIEVSARSVSSFLELNQFHTPHLFILSNNIDGFGGDIFDFADKGNEDDKYDQ